METIFSEFWKDYMKYLFKTSQDSNENIKKKFLDNNYKKLLWKLQGIFEKFCLKVDSF